MYYLSFTMDEFLKITGKVFDRNCKVTDCAELVKSGKYSWLQDTSYTGCCTHEQSRSRKRGTYRLKSKTDSGEKFMMGVGINNYNDQSVLNSNFKQINRGQIFYRLINNIITEINYLNE